MFANCLQENVLPFAMKKRIKVIAIKQKFRMLKLSYPSIIHLSKKRKNIYRNTVSELVCGSGMLWSMVEQGTKMKTDYWIFY